MEPVSITLAIAAGVFVTSSFGYAFGRRKERRTPAMLEAVGANRELQSRILDLEQELKSYVEDVARKDADIERISLQKDQYKAIATSHEVTYPERPEVDQHPWDKRRFCGHPGANLRAMVDELKPYEGHEVKMTVRVSGAGQFSAWGRIMEERWGHTKDGKRVSSNELGPWVYHGNVSRAFRDFNTQITDDDSGFMERTGKTNRSAKVWKDTDSPILFEVSLEICDVAPLGLPEIHTVEVAVVEEVVVREVIEKPVYISIPEGREAELCGHTVEQIQGHVREVIARAEAEEEIEALGQISALEKVKDDSRSEQTRLRQAKSSRRVLSE